MFYNKSVSNTTETLSKKSMFATEVEGIIWKMKTHICHIEKIVKFIRNLVVK